MLRPPIILHDVVKSYETPSGSFMALKKVSLEIQQGEFIAVVGKSGSGKTTLLNVIAGIDRPSSGSVTVAGQALQELSEHQLSTWRGTTVGIVFQFFQLLPTLTALENVMLAMDFCKKYPARERRARAMELLAKVGVSEQSNKLPATLSGGQQQRVAIARALANAPTLIVADEPSGNLDSVTAATVLGLLRTLADSGTTVVVATHDKDIAALSDRSIYVADGKLESVSASASVSSAQPLHPIHLQQGAG
ncbi:ABC-type antimicrobial peptide transport system ATPase component [Solimicrobium silvestre]|uniref:ABC-type antimicrobial peptide transport system ATPase component n=2 Tax=Solimicrobium silvestre TaxID=2099400 RepID=A0A2S9GVP0_9BURK|nr:ABC-type antimicrobial peptide transport system ATPase component [Solimicrobium silvestre]